MLERRVAIATWVQCVYGSSRWSSSSTVNQDTPSQDRANQQPRSENVVDEHLHKPSSTPPGVDDSHNGTSTAKDPLGDALDAPNQQPVASGGPSGDVTSPETEPDRWLQQPYQDPDVAPIVDEKGEYIVSKGNWPTGEVAYRTPEPPGHLAPRFGYNVLQVKKDVSWWQHYHKYPRFSIVYLNVQFLFLVGLAWMTAYLMTEYRTITDEMKTPGAMVGEHRGRGPSTKGSQKITFTTEEMTALIGGAQEKWLDGKGETNYLGSKDYRMKQIARPKEFSTEDFRKR
jgi:hypothetical protein